MLRVARPLLALTLVLAACGEIPTQPTPPGEAHAPLAAAAAPGLTMASPATFVDVSAGLDFSCGLRSDGSITCWGANGFGQLDVPAGSYVSLDAGPFEHYVCAIRTDATLACWGGAPNERGILNAPAGTFTQVSIGLVHACGLRTDGSIACWGTNSHGQMNVPARNDFVKVASGFEYTCGLRTDGNVQCWGRGLIGTRTITGPWTDLSSSYAASCMIRPDGSLACLGRFLEPGAEAGPPTSGTWVALDGGALGTCGIDEAGAVACWSSDTVIRHATPPAGAFVAVDLGHEHACALDAAGAVTCWGNPANGRLEPPPPPNAAPTATFEAPSSVLEGSPVTLSLSAVVDEDVSGVTYAFDCGAGFGSAGPTPTATCPTSDDGALHVRGRVTDAQGAASLYGASVTVSNVAPTVAAPAGSRILAGETFTANGSFTDPGADTWTAFVTWGDGAPPSTLSLTGSKFALAHTYALAGTYSVTVTVMDDDGGVGRATFSVKVQTPAEGTSSLSSTVDELVQSGVVPPSTGAPLQTTLNQARASFEKRNDTAGVNQLGAFQNQVAAAERSRRIPTTTSEELITAAEKVKTSAGAKKKKP